MRVDDWLFSSMNKVASSLFWLNHLKRQSGIFQLESPRRNMPCFLRRALHQLCFFDVLFHQQIAEIAAEQSTDKRN